MSTATVLPSGTRAPLLILCVHPIRAAGAAMALRAAILDTAFVTFPWCTKQDMHPGQYSALYTAGYVVSKKKNDFKHGNKTLLASQFYQFKVLL